MATTSTDQDQEAESVETPNPPPPLFPPYKADEHLIAILPEKNKTVKVKVTCARPKQKPPKTKKKYSRNLKTGKNQKDVEPAVWEGLRTTAQVEVPNANPQSIIAAIAPAKAKRTKAQIQNDSNKFQRQLKESESSFAKYKKDSGILLKKANKKYSLLQASYKRIQQRMKNLQITTKIYSKD